MEKSAKKGEENAVVKWFRGVSHCLVNFVREVRAELRKVQWPNRKETVTYTTIVVVASLGLSFFIWIVDQGLALLLRWLMA